MTGNEIRKRFIEFFGSHGHHHLPSSGLIPRNDPTLLFTNAGMVQFKGLFLGEERPSQPRAVTVQKCVRAGGKHNDLENVGRTARHHTFFEMLGNFSFGDYFKELAIPLAWEFVTTRLELPVERLLVTIYANDDEAYAIWRATGVPEERIIRIASDDNFWSMGKTGPCGPCSEIFYDYGPEVAGGPPGSAEADGDRFVEIWNLVFMQYNRDEAGTLTPLPHPCIDTGAGLERIASILQGVTSNYHSDIFMPLITAAAQLAGVEYGRNPESDVSLRVIADHIRAAGFLIAEGILPSNEGRGYVLRRIMRRGMRHGRQLGLEEPFLHRLTPVLAAVMGTTYPEVTTQEGTISLVIANEERRFAATLGTGLKILEEAVRALPAGEPLSGATAFTLYDTYGFPLDLTADILRDRGIAVDQAGFQHHMAEQRKRARAAWQGAGGERIAAIYHTLLEAHGPSEFLGYVTIASHGEITALLDAESTETGALGPGVRGGIVVNQTPFYGESGGQVGDWGTISGEGFRFRVENTRAPLPGLLVHHGVVEDGTATVGAGVRLEVDSERRLAIRAHHSATHLLHHALRQVLGGHVKQAGSLVAAERLRFDFSHFQGVTPEELATIELLVNREICANPPQETAVMEPQEAVAVGAMALFGEKYGDQVRVVRIGPSLELCGGTHVTRAGDIGVFRILSESAVAAGVRRIEAVCGLHALRQWQEESAAIKQTAGLLRMAPHQLGEGVEKLLTRVRELEKLLEQAKGERAGNLVEELVTKAEHHGSIALLVTTVSGVDPEGLRELMDRLKDRLPQAVIVLGVAGGDKVALIAGVTKELSARIKAGEIIKTASAMVGGKGGGRPDLAQGGGSEVAKLGETLRQVRESLVAQLG